MPSSSPPPIAGRIRVGPAGWSYKDWEGTVYPQKPGSRFDQLAWLASYFDTIEVNSSFYRVPPVSHSMSWRRRVAFNPDFSFTVKLYRGFTHEPELSLAEVEAFRRFLDPLAEDGRLGALLVQYPWSFRNAPGSLARMERVFEAFHEVPRVVEVRHGSFQNEEFLRFLDERNVGIANIDQPLFSDSVKPGEAATGPVGYIRLHGRNYAKWFQHEESWERYDYLYSKEELRPWADRARELARQRDVYVITNNHFRGQAIANAVELRGELGQAVNVPPTLTEAFPGRFVSER